LRPSLTAIVVLLATLVGQAAWGAEQKTAPAVGAPLTAGPVITDTAVPQPTGYLTINPFWYFNCTGGKFSTTWRRVSAGGDFFSLNMPTRIIYGPFPNVEVYLIVPYLHNWAANVNLPGPQGQRAANFGGLGDTSFTAKYQFWEEAARRPTITGLCTVTFPTGHTNRLNPGNLGTDLLGGGVYTFTCGLNMSKWVAPFYLYANLWYGISTTGLVNRQPRRLPDQVTVNLAAEWVLGPPHWVLLGELYSTWEPWVFLGGTTNLAPAMSMLSALIGVEYVLNFRWNFTLAFTTTLAGKNMPYNYSPVFTMNYTF